MLTLGVLLQPAGVSQYQGRSLGCQPHRRRGAPGWPDLEVSYGQADNEAFPLLDEQDAGEEAEHVIRSQIIWPETTSQVMINTFR